MGVAKKRKDKRKWGWVRNRSIGKDQSVMGNEEEKEENKWLKHYSSKQQILLVGDGDFSFSLCLAHSFGSAHNIIATSLDSYDEVIKKYKEAKSNLIRLKKLGASILHNVDATRMKRHTDLIYRKFDRIIFNFPHAGFQGRENSNIMIRRHRALVNGFFLNAKSMLRPYGEIHVNHKTTAPFSDWRLDELASGISLVLIERVEFKIEDYPRYKQKRGDGRRCDQPFPIGKSSTFKFRFSPSPNNKIHGKNETTLSNSLCIDESRETHIAMFDLNTLVHEVGSGFNGDMITIQPQSSLNQNRHIFPEFKKKTCFHIESRESKTSFGFSKDSLMVYRERILSQGYYVPESNQRACYRISAHVNEHEYRLSGDSMTLNQDSCTFAEMDRRVVCYQQRSKDSNERHINLRRTKTLRIVRTYGN